MPDHKDSPAVNDKKKLTAESRRDSRQTIEEEKSESSPSQNEIKQFKEALLKSVATVEQTETQPSILEYTEGVARSRSRSASRGHELIARQDLLKDLDEDKLFELKEAFLLFDLNGDGCIDYHDLRGTLISLGETVDDNAVKAMLSEATHPLDFDAFVCLLGYKTLELDSEESLIAALSRWDSDNSGYISEERIRRDLTTRGDKFTEKEADYALDEAPTVERGGRIMIDYVRFCYKLCGLRKARNNDEMMTL